MIKTIKKGKEVSIRKIRTVVILREVRDRDWEGSMEESERLRKFYLLTTWVMVTGCSLCNKSSVNSLNFV